MSSHFHHSLTPFIIRFLPFVIICLFLHKEVCTFAPDFKHKRQMKKQIARIVIMIAVSANTLGMFGQEVEMTSEYMVTSDLTNKQGDDLGKGT